MSTVSKPGRKKPDPLLVFRRGTQDLRYGNGDRAIASLFEAAQPEMPAELRNALKTLTRWVRRVVARSNAAKAAATAGNQGQAWRLFDQAKAINAKRPPGVIVKNFRGSSLLNAEDLGRTAQQAGEDMLSSVYRFIHQSTR